MSFFIEVGACDFDTCEQLIHNGWKGIVIEPVKHYYDKLTKYPQIHYENIAISDKEGESEIHYINPEQIVHENQQWLKGISSLEGATGPMTGQRAGMFILFLLILQNFWVSRAFNITLLVRLVCHMCVNVYPFGS